MKKIKPTNALGLKILTSLIVLLGILLSINLVNSFSINTFNYPIFENSTGTIGTAILNNPQEHCTNITWNAYSNMMITDFADYTNFDPYITIIIRNKTKDIQEEIYDYDHDGIATSRYTYKPDVYGICIKNNKTSGQSRIKYGSSTTYKFYTITGTTIANAPSFNISNVITNELFNVLDTWFFRNISIPNSIYITNAFLNFSGYNRECIQETVNASHVSDAIMCNLNYSGYYVNNFNYNPNQTNDGNWETAGRTSGTDDNVYMYYIKPKGAIGAIWETKTGESPPVRQNFTIDANINADCWNYSPNNLSLTIRNDHNGDQANYIYCFNTSGWKLLYQDTSAGLFLYEEKIHWITDYPNTTYINIGGEDIEHTINFTSIEDEGIHIFNTTNKTKNFANLINNYISNGCDSTMLGSNCQVPTIFYSLGYGYIGYSNILINNEGFLENSQNYSVITHETDIENFFINFSYDNSEYTLSSVYLNYNGTNYLADSTGSGNILSNRSVYVPAVLTPSTNVSFYWRIGLTNVTGTFYYNTTTNNQTINKNTPISINSTCPVGTSPALNFTSFFEVNRTNINFTTVKYFVSYGLAGNSTFYTINDSLSNINSFAICINNSQDYFNLGYGEIQYSVTGAVDRRYYVFSNTRITNQTINIPIYALESSSSTSFLITAQDTNLNLYKDHYIGLLRWYPEINSYQVVELGKTDDNGQTVLHVKTEDVDYRLALYSPDGTLIKLLSPIRMVCQTTPCIYSIIVTSELDLTTFLNIQNNLTFNPTTKVFTYVFNDPSQDTTSMNLTVWQDYPDRDSIIICNSVSNSYTGVLICDVSAYSGQLRAEVYRSASPPILIAQLISDVRQTLVNVANGNQIVLLLGFILVVTFALMGTMSPVLVIILSLIGLIPLIFLGAFGYSIFIVIGVIAGIVLHFLRRVS